MTLTYETVGSKEPWKFGGSTGLCVKFPGSNSPQIFPAPSPSPSPLLCWFHRPAGHYRQGRRRRHGTSCVGWSAEKEQRSRKTAAKDNRTPHQGKWSRQTQVRQQRLHSNYLILVELTILWKFILSSFRIFFFRWKGINQALFLRQIPRTLYIYMTRFRFRLCVRSASALFVCSILVHVLLILKAETNMSVVLNFHLFTFIPQITNWAAYTTGCLLPKIRPPPPPFATVLAMAPQGSAR